MRIRTDWEKTDGKDYQVADHEPYSTLASYRTLKNFGIVFGMYYTLTILNNQRIYDAILPNSMGYPTFSESIAKNNMSQR